MSGVPIEGICDPRFAAVREAFADNFAPDAPSGADVGASATLIIGGHTAVDLWGGHLDAERTRPWERDTIVNVFSTTKTMCNLVALALAGRGELDLDAPVARYWPEFAAAGKEGVLVRHLLAHTAGLSGWDEPLTTEDLYDHGRCADHLAAQAPWWEPGTRSGYHAITQGYLVGEVVRRVTGRTLGRWFAEEIAGPLDADFHIGTGAAHDHRIGALIPALPLAGGVSPDPASLGYRTMANPTLRAEASATVPWRRAEIPAAGGHGNARSVARAQAAVSHGGTFDGHRVLPPEVCERILEVQAAGRDLVLGIGVTFGIGYGLNSPRAPIGPNARLCYWGGWGGSLVVNDLEAGFTLAYVMNRMGEGTVGDDRAHTLLRAVYAALGG